jgi:hypothetical protein
MERELRSLVRRLSPTLNFEINANRTTEHTLLVTADGVEILTARSPDSPGGPIPMPGIEVVEAKVVVA